MFKPDYSKCIFVEDPKAKNRRQQNGIQQKKRGFSKRIVPAIEFSQNYQFQLRVETLKGLLEVPEGGNLNFQHIKRTQDEIKDFKRFLEFQGRDPVQWMKYLD